MSAATCPACGRTVGTQTASGTATTVLRPHGVTRGNALDRCAGSRTVVR